MKWFLRIAVVLVLLVVIGAVLALVMIDDIARTAVREGAAFATQTDVELEKVDVKLLSTEGEIKKLDIKNPDGPSREVFDSFMKLGNGKAQITAGSVLSDKIVIPKVELSDIELSLVSRDGKKNYETILESLKRFQGDGPPPEETEGGKQIEITLTTISRITVNYDFDRDPALGAVPATGTVKIAFDKPMVIENLGAGGVPISQITADLIADILVQVMANLAGDLGGHMKGLASSLTDTLGEAKLGETLKELDLGGNLEALGDLGLDVGDLGLDAVQGVGKGAGDLIRGITGGGDDKKDDENKEGEDKKDEGGSLLDDINPF